MASSRVEGLDPELAEAMMQRLEELQSAAAVDELTGVLRRGAGRTALEREVRRASRQEDRRVVLAFLDVQHLKEVNDRRGHGAGDDVLIQIASTLKGRLRAHDLIIRWGGDEFVCVLSQAGRDQVAAVMTTLEREVRSRTGCGLHIGLAEMAPGEAAQDLLARADADLYSRRRGSGRES